MKTNTYTEENYLKAIYKLEEKDIGKITTNAIAEMVDTAPASVTDMLKKLADKKFIKYEKYQGVSLTNSGKKVAITIIRKHRLWELFLVEKLKFKWDEVHEIAEQLEHIVSDELINRLDNFLDNPQSDPHGDPIPDERGQFHSRKAFPLSDANSNAAVTITGVIDHHPAFLQYLDKCGLLPGNKVTVKEIIDYDKSLNILLNGSKSLFHISFDVAKNILVRR
jgi:DtxR family transcriptional regulator, Mn-dependent transcriptional regulator